MKYDLKQVNDANKTYEEKGKIIKLGICLLKDEDIYGEWVKDETTDEEVLEIPDRPFFYINDGDQKHPIYLNKDGCYEFSNENDEILDIASFTIPEKFPPFTAEYIVVEESGQN